MYKLIAIDLDGTMLNSYSIITPQTKEAIKKAQESGIEVIIASGRSIDSVRTLAKEINSEKYAICGNGAIIYDMKNKEILYENILKKQKTLDIIKICEENSIYYNVYTENEIISKNLQYNTLYYYRENLKKAEEDKTHINIVENIYEYIQKHDDKILKIMICDSHESVFKSIVKKLKEIEDVEVLDVSHQSRKMISHGTEEVALEYFYTEVSAKNVDKWNALEILAEKLQIKAEDIMTIGDNSNDLQMIKNAGLGVAMGQSAPNVKKVANFVTANNDENGVAQAILKVLK